jgi:hypothetical protein
LMLHCTALPWALPPPLRCPAQEERGRALDNLPSYETSTPTEGVVESLATDPVGRSGRTFAGSGPCC